MSIWCLCPIASSYTNGLGLYDGFATSVSYMITWGIPYLMGRVYFTRLEHLNELALGVVVGGLYYVPLCLWEMRMSPQLHYHVYGMEPTGWGEVVYGGYRPKVFIGIALELAAWMAAASTTAVWLWLSGTVESVWNFRIKWVALALCGTTILCKVTGSWFLLLIGTGLWFALKWSNTRIPTILMILIPLTYIVTRSTGFWSGEHAVTLVETLLNQRRAESLGVRITNENQLVAKALLQPIFGWGGWSRARIIIEETGEDVSLTDGMWVIALGNNGLVGLGSFYSSLLLPMFLITRRFSAPELRTPPIAAACALATVTNLHAVDCIANAMVNPIYSMILGAVTGVLSHKEHLKEFCQKGTSSPTRDENRAGSRISHTTPGGSGSGEFSNNLGPRVDAAVKQGEMGRAFRDRGMFREAEESLSSAIDAWANLVTDYPDDPDLRRYWLDGLNDSAWFLAHRLPLDARSISRAIQQAEQTVAIDPGGAAYWNTLGIVYFRSGNWESAIRALQRSCELSFGGTAYDYLFLSMSYSRSGDRAQARVYFAKAERWIKVHGSHGEDLPRFYSECSSLIA